METTSYEFAGFHLDPADCTLRRGADPVPLTPKAFDTLLLLIENRGRLVEKQEMMQRLWPDAVVEEANLANNISLLRKVLGDDVIQTVPRRGYRFVAPVTVPVLVPPRPATRGEGPGVRGWLLIAIVAAIAAFLTGRATKRTDPPRFTQLTFRRGNIWSARFTPDAQTVVYSATYEGKPPALFESRVDQTATRPLGETEAQILSISKHGELALLLKRREMLFIAVGTLARKPLAGGAPRELATDVQEADWLPDGERLAAIRWPTATVQVEFPLGKPVYSAPPPQWVSGLRVSPRGDEVAFLLHESARLDDRGRAVIVDANGKIVASSREFTSANGLAWRDDALVISAADDANNAIFAIDRRGRERVIARTAGRLVLHDAASSGALLVAQEQARTGIIVRAPGEANERELSWLDGSWVRDISADGRTILFDEEGNGGGATARVFLRTVDGAPAIDLGPGHALALSPDGKWALSRQRFTHPPRLVLMPTGPGETRVLQTGAIEPMELASFAGDGRIVFAGMERGHKRRSYLLDLATNAVRPLTPEGAPSAVTDGHVVIAEGVAYPLDGGAPSPAPHLTPRDHPLRYDGRTAWLLGDDIQRVDLTTGERKVVFTKGSGLPRDAVFSGSPALSAGGSAYAYTYASVTSDLFLMH